MDMSMHAPRRCCGAMLFRRQRTSLCGRDALDQCPSFIKILSRHQKNTNFCPFTENGKIIESLIKIKAKCDAYRYEG